MKKKFKIKAIEELNVCLEVDKIYGGTFETENGERYIKVKCFLESIGFKVVTKYSSLLDRLEVIDIIECEE